MPPLHFTAEINAECISANNSRYKLLAQCVDYVIGCIEHIVENSAHLLIYAVMPVYLVSLKPKNIKYVTCHSKSELCVLFNGKIWDHGECRV